MKFKAVRKMSRDDLRRLCIRENYFTRGDNEEYEELLSMLNDNPKMTKDLYKEIAEIIFEHSNVETMKIQYGCGDDDLMADILFKLYNDASITLIVREED